MEPHCWVLDTSWQVGYEVNLPVVQSGHDLACEAQESCKSGLKLIAGLSWLWHCIGWHVNVCMLRVLLIC